LYAHNFRIYFIPLSGVLFTFPSRYLSTIDRKTYLALEGGPSGFSQGFSCPDLLDKRDEINLISSNNKVSDTSHTWLSQSMAVLSRTFCSPRKFLTLCRLVTAPAYQYGNLDESRTPHWLITCHNPLPTFVCQLIHLANCQMEVNKVWADPRSLATTNGLVVYFPFLRVLRCFSSPAYRFLSYEFR
jgi:hypothetical protein